MKVSAWKTNATKQQQSSQDTIWVNKFTIQASLHNQSTRKAKRCFLIRELSDDNNRTNVLLLQRKKLNMTIHFPQKSYKQLMKWSLQQPSKYSGLLLSHCLAIWETKNKKNTKVQDTVSPDRLKCVACAILDRLPCKEWPVQIPPYITNWTVWSDWVRRVLKLLPSSNENLFAPLVLLVLGFPLSQIIWWLQSITFFSNKFKYCTQLLPGHSCERKFDCQKTIQIKLGMGFPSLKEPWETEVIILWFFHCWHKLLFQK